MTRIHKHLCNNKIFTTYSIPGTMLDTKDINVIRIAFVIEDLYPTKGSWGVEVWESI